MRPVETKAIIFGERAIASYSSTAVNVAQGSAPRVFSPTESLQIFWALHCKKGLRIPSSGLHLASQQKAFLVHHIRTMVGDTQDKVRSRSTGVKHFSYRNRRRICKNAFLVMTS